MTRNEPLFVEAQLPLLALQAASELDAELHGVSTSLESVGQLHDMLGGALPSSPDPKGVGLFDAGSIAIFCQALESVQPDAPVRSWEDLVTRVLEITGTLQTPKGAHDLGKIAKLRDFCIALSDAASSFRRSLLEAPPLHPFEA